MPAQAQEKIKPRSKGRAGGQRASHAGHSRVQSSSHDQDAHATAVNEPIGNESSDRELGDGHRRPRSQDSLASAPAAHRGDMSAQAAGEIEIVG
jgi:hypothetical protein